MSFLAVGDDSYTLKLQNVTLVFGHNPPLPFPVVLMMPLRTANFPLDNVLTRANRPWSHVGLIHTPYSAVSAILPAHYALRDLPLLPYVPVPTSRREHGTIESVGAVQGRPFVVAIVSRGVSCVIPIRFKIGKVVGLGVS
jgi:hypothetical protein